VIERLVVTRRAWPKGIQKVRASAFGGQRWPHDTLWSGAWLTVVARWDGRLVGFVMLRDVGDGMIDLNDLAVAVDYQQRGIGQAICDDAVEWMRELGHERIVGLPISTGSGRIFGRLGFQRAGPGYQLIL
jgi:predicted N-acetyltransferase YhbS